MTQTRTWRTLVPALQVSVGSDVAPIPALCGQARGHLRRSPARDLLGIAERLRDAGAGLRDVTDPWADMMLSAGRVVLTVFVGNAESRRTNTGREAAKQPSG